MKFVPARISDKPHYVLHPTRLARRALHHAGLRSDALPEVALARLPWGLDLEVHPKDAIGYSILATGMFDPAVSETLHRLTDRGDLVFDIGANVGYLTSLAATRVGPAGTVVAYEPHPRVFDRLRANAARWATSASIGKVQLRQAAVSHRSGTARLAFGPHFERNMGLAALHPDGEPSARMDLIAVAVERLDDIVGDSVIGVLKIDVEGHEPEVLRGAERLLATGRIRDIVFEDHDPYPDASTQMLEAAGYHLIALSNDLFGLRLRDPESRGPLRGWPGPSYLATRDPERAIDRLAPRGWQVDGIGFRRSTRRRGATEGTAR